MAWPSTLIMSCERSALVPSSRTTLPFTSTLPSWMSCSALRREAMPAWARIFCSRSCMGLDLGCFGIRSSGWGERGRGGLAGLVGDADGPLQLIERVVALRRRLGDALGGGGVDLQG